MHILAAIIKSLVAGITAKYLQDLLRSEYIIELLDKNLITILIALLAINTTTSGIILAKVRDLSDQNGALDFAVIKKSMFSSIIEQLSNICIALLLFTLYHSSYVIENAVLISIIQVGIFACFAYGMLCLYDTAKGVFKIVDL